MKRFRYPGAQSFSSRDRDLFFGRQQDIQRLSQMINLNKMIVLYGKSGLGKTSLLQAGVIPSLTKEGYLSKTIRFTAYNSQGQASPLSIFKDQIKEELHSSNFLQKVGVQDSSLWYMFKTAQIQHPDQKGFIIVFDQFEELFSYPDEAVDAFKKELAHVINLNVSSTFKEALKAKIDLDEEFVRQVLHHKLSEDDLFLARSLKVGKDDVRTALKDRLQDDRDFLKRLLKQDIALKKDYLSKEEIDQIYEPLNIKVVIGIRSDRLSLLDKLTDYLPNIMKRMYELKPLQLEQAAKAITIPASLSGTSFTVPPFTYAEGALDKILSYLSDENREVEPFQIQYVCEQAEQTIYKSGKKQIQAEDLGNLNELFKNYYFEKLKEIESEEDKLKARRLIEQGLLFNRMRLSLLGEQITSPKFQFAISPALLQRLEHVRLLRAENRDNKVYYEITHDTLIEPISRAYEEREIKERFEKEQQIENTRKAEEAALLLKQQKENRARIRRARTVIVIIGIAALVSIGTAIWAMAERTSANLAKSEAILALQRAEDLQHEAENAQHMLEEKNAAILQNERDLIRQKEQLSATLASLEKSEIDLKTQIQIAQQALVMADSAGRESTLYSSVYKALLARDTQDYQKAIEFYTIGIGVASKALETTEDSILLASLLVSRAEVYSLDKNIGRAYDNYQSAINTVRKELQPFYHIKRAEFLIEFNDKNYALRDFNAAIAKSNPTNRPRYYISRALFWHKHNNNIEEAKADFQHAIDSAIGDRSLLLLERAKFHTDIKAFELAEKDYMRAFQEATSPKAYHEKWIEFYQRYGESFYQQIKDKAEKMNKMMGPDSPKFFIASKVAEAYDPNNLPNVPSADFNYYLLKKIDALYHYRKENPDFLAQILEAYSKIITTTPRDQRGTFLLRRAKLYQEQKNYSLAEADYKAAIQFSTEEQKSARYQDLADFYVEQQDYDRAVNLYTKSIETLGQTQQDGRKITLYKNRGELQSSVLLQKYKKAIIDYRELLSLFPQNATRFYNQYEGRYYYQTDFYDKISELFLKLEMPDSARAVYHSAIPNATEATQLILYARIGDLFVQQQDFNEALASYQEAIKIANRINAPESQIEDLYGEMGKTYAQMGNTDQALVIFKGQLNRIHQVDEKLEFLLRRARILATEEIGMLNQAIQDYQDVIKISDAQQRGYELLEAREALSRIYLGQNKANKALALFADKENINWPSPIELGRSLARAELFEKAVEAFRKAIEQDPTDLWPWYLQGRSYYYMHEFDKAIKSFDKAIELLEKYPKRNILAGNTNTYPYYRRGNIHRILGNYEQALKDIQYAISKDQTNGYSYAFLAMTYAEQGMETLFYENLEKAISKDMTTPFPLEEQIKFEKVLEHYSTTLPFQLLLEKSKNNPK